MQNTIYHRLLQTLRASTLAVSDPSKVTPASLYIPLRLCPAGDVTIPLVEKEGVKQQANVLVYSYGVLEK